MLVSDLVLANYSETEFKKRFMRFTKKTLVDLLYWEAKDQMSRFEKTGRIAKKHIIVLTQHDCDFFAKTSSAEMEIMRPDLRLILKKGSLFQQIEEAP